MRSLTIFRSMGMFFCDRDQVVEQQLQQQILPLTDTGGSESEWFVSDQEEELIRLLSVSESNQPAQRNSDLLLLLM